MRAANDHPITVRDRLRDLVDRAKAAAKRKDWKENYRLCREHDDLALANGVPGPAWVSPHGGWR